ncbi:hypothetical protein BFP72_11190 [Reichenbachiella sp. 5M10]|uniref:hypothetical protein n=1 Tax=Reichenbachiella sp. 5M10 TaxID=1889772 RepID=UPI000C157CAA|nr:hypothetical protein [Reichenbachiella sp. 5M10]PIB35916.1 hypothetical protein BFP72_11190 [Reichenbachiella sp. 5M10]
MNKALLIFCLALGLMTSCGPRAHFKSSSSYQPTNNIEELYLIVVGDEKTKAAYGYLTDNLKDSLSSYVSVDSKYHCCRDENTDMNVLFSSLRPSSPETDHVLTVVTTKVIVGYGTTSSRELGVALFDIRSQKMVWQGTISASFEWFISDENYRAVAKTLANKIMKELHEKNII